MIAQLRSELFKQRTTRTARVLLASMAGVTLLVVCLHVFTLDATDLTSAENQTKIFGWGTTLGALFGALAGAIGITAEFRHGSIRPTLLANPSRTRVLLAKSAAAAISGLGIGLLAAALVAATGSIGLALRDIPIALDAGDFAQMIVGGAAGAALWAVLGTGIGAVLRGQVGAVVGLCVWLLLLENILIGNVPSEGRFAPGASDGALAGLMPNAGTSTLLAPAVGALLLAGYAAVTAAAGLAAIERRDID
jgi:ABC-type transport system involved in multi-copper enzyme maturation permease subunit